MTADVRHRHSLFSTSVSGVSIAANGSVGASGGPNNSLSHGLSQNLSHSVGHSEMPPVGRKKSKHDVCLSFLGKLRERHVIDVTEELEAGVEQHFHLLPSRYAYDVNLDSLDVLNHKRLLDSARADPSAVSFQVRQVDISTSPNLDKGPSFGSSGALLEAAVTAAIPHRSHRPAFGSSPNLQALMLENNEDGSDWQPVPQRFFEVTIASVDQPRLLSRLSDALGDLNLNICEAHAFNTKDKFSLDVFVVSGWTGQGTSDLEDVLSERLEELPHPASRLTSLDSAQRNTEDLDQPQELQSLANTAQERMAGEASASDDWELDPADLEFHEKINSGAFGDLYRGSFCGQDVAIKILRNVQNDSAQYSEFLQEVSIMKKVRHKNVVQFIGACTQKPNLCIVFEFMPCGSLYDHLKSDGPPRLSQLLKAATEICKGMDYLHKRQIIHRDLKAANLLTDETGGLKIADFGVARMLTSAGVMTAETGTYRWMAPEVIEHAPYGAKADVFSFGIVLWELLTGKVPYSDMTPLQAAVGVVQKGLRPPIPVDCPTPLADIMRQCWARNPKDRPDFETLKGQLENLCLAAKAEEQAALNAASAKKNAHHGLLSKLHHKLTK